MISSDLLEKHTNSISNLIQQYKADAELQLHDLDKYVKLINDEEINYVRTFLKAEPPNPFEKYSELIDYYDRLSTDIPLEFYWTTFTDLFKIRRHNVIRHFATTASQLKNELVSKMVSDYQQKVRA